MNSLKDIERNLRYIAKRNKFIKYTVGTAVAFLLMGYSAFAEEVVSRKEIGSKAKNLYSTVQKVKKENKEKIDGAKLELIQLMEQADQVTKSPWASWQFGLNYMYDNYQGEYKGRGDKEKKYPYEGIYERSSNVFVRNVTIDDSQGITVLSNGTSTLANSSSSDERKKQEIDKILKKLGEDKRNQVSSAINSRSKAKDYGVYGLTDREVIKEVPYEIQIAATIRPRSIDKQPPKVEVGEVKIEKLNPAAAPTPPSEPTAPNIYIPGFSPIAPNVTPPTLPVPPTFAVVLGSDCNDTCSSNGQPRRQTKDFLDSDKNLSKQNVPVILHYTWTDRDVPEEGAKGLAFKMWREEKGMEESDPSKIYFNSYNFDKDGQVEFDGPIMTDDNYAHSKNKQYFFVGGSRFIEIDNVNTTGKILPGKIVNLGGILTLALVSQGNSGQVINEGIITDIEEKDEEWIKQMPTDPGKDYLTIIGPTEDYHIKRSADGYVGYKVGIALVQEDYPGSSQVFSNAESGVIDFRGKRSIGMYTYLPIKTAVKPLENKGQILLSGEESYGMKLASHTSDKSGLINAGTITLRKNPDGVDKADNSAAMALMVDTSVKKKVNLADGKAVNTETGTINLQDNIENAIGMYVNIDSNMTNNGIINISAKSEGGPNSGMRADQVDENYMTHENYDTTVINAKTINITGKNGIGMIANGKTTKGTATALNKKTGTITITGGETNYGLFANDEATVENKGTITIKDSKNSIGMASLYDQAKSKTSTATNNGKIEVNSANSTGVYNTGIFSMNNQNAKVLVDGNQSVGVYAAGDNSKTTLSAGTISVKHSGVGLYSDKAKITLDNTSNNLNLIADEGGLLFYNYESDNPLNSSGKFELKGNVKAEIKDKGYGFYIKGAEITEHGGITGVTEFLNSMFAPSAANQDLNIALRTGGTLMILDKPTGEAMNLSTVSTLQNLNSSLGEKVKLETIEDGSKIFSVYRGKLELDQNVNLDEPTDAIYKLNFLSSSIKNLEDKTITGTKAGQLAMFQSNYSDGVTSGAIDEIKVINEGKIVLTGNSNTSKTTTAMAGDFITLTNSGDIEVAANKTIGMFGSGGSIVENSGNILVGEEGTALFGVNKLGDSSLGDNHITLTNSGTIKVADGHTKAFGMYANNDITTFTTLTSADSVLKNSGTIDLSNASESMGIGAKNSTVINSGKILLGDKGVAINSESSSVTSSGDIELGANGIAFNLIKIGATDKFDLTSKVKLNGTGSSILNLTDSEFDTSSTNMKANLTIERKNNDDMYNYYSLNNSKLVNTEDKTLTGNNIIMVNSTNSEVDWQGNVTMTGNKNIAFYATGTKNDPEIKVSNGTIKLDGESSIGIYAENGARIENSSEVSVGKKGIGIYGEGANTKVTNSGNLTLLEEGTGIFLKEIDGNNFSNTGKISSDSKNAKGIVFKKAASNAFENSGEINLTGVSSIGVYSEGADHIFTNKGKITVGNTPSDESQSVGIYATTNGIVVNEGEINAGDGSIGIFGQKVTMKTGSSVNVKDGAIGIYSQGDKVDLQAGSKMKIGNDDAVALYYNGNGGTVDNSLTSLEIGKNSMGIVIGGNNNTVTNNLPTVDLKGDSIYTYSTDKAGTITGKTKITAATDNNYGYYTAGNLNNTGDIDFSQGLGNIGIYSITDNGQTGKAKNSGTILVGKSDVDNNIYSIGMAAGYYEKDENTGVVTERYGSIENTGNIVVNDENSIGMYAAGQGSKAVNSGTITVKAKKGIGMFITDKAIGENTATGKIILEVGADNSVGVYVAKNSVFKNYGQIIINANNSKAMIYSSDSNVHEGTIADNGTGNTKAHKVTNPGGSKEFGNLDFIVQPNFTAPTKIVVNGKVVTPTKIDTSSANPDAAVEAGSLDIPHNDNPYLNMQNLGAASAIGMYVDTSGINFTNPIEGLQHLQGLKNVDLIIGSEATEYTNSKAVEIGENILKRYNKEILNNPQIEKWNVVSGALTWAAAPGEYDSNTGFKNVVMAKIDYKEFSNNDKNLYNFLDGLEQRYDKNKLDSKEKELFNKINNIGKNEEILFTQAIDEMLGHQYGNVQQRIYDTGNILNKEFRYLKEKWDTKSKDSNKIKAFGMRGEYNTDTAGIIDYKTHAEGFAYLHEDETAKLGNGTGWYTGFVHNRFNFKDIGESREHMHQVKLGIFKSKAFDHNNSLNWTISGEGFVGYNTMKRRYLVVDEIYRAKANYWSYGVGLNNEISKTIRTSEHTFIKPYGNLKLEYGRFEDIEEKHGEVRLEVNGNDYFSVKPELGVELGTKHLFGNKRIATGLSVAYETELGKVQDVDNEVRVNYTNADWYNIRSEKEDRDGNVKLDLNASYDNEIFGVTANIGYDTKGENVRGGVGLRIIF